MNADVLSRIVEATSAATVAQVAALVTLLAAMVGAVVGRRRWVDRVETRRGSGPYRHTLVVEQRAASAPPLLLAAALGCIAFGHLFPPIIVIALVRFPLDGMAASLAAGIPIGVWSLACGWRIFWRAAPARATMRSLVRGLFILSAALFVLAAAHIGLALHPNTDGVELALIGLVLAAAACALATLLLFAERGAVALEPERS